MIIRTEKPRFVFPEAEGEDFAVLKKRLYEYNETIFVDDYVEVKNMIKEMQSLDSEKIQKELVPKLETLI